jgi:flagella basal body P-ring formation protein FlgA
MLSVIYALLLAGFMLAVAAPAWAADAEAPAETPDAPDQAVTLKPIVELNAAQIRLGDVFSDAGAYADRVIARAPEPGEEMVLPAVWLWKVAKTFGVDWRPTSKADTVTVTRPSTIVGTAEIEALLRDAYFRRTGEDDLIELETEAGPARIHLPMSVAPSARIERFDLDPRSGRYTATLIAPAEGQALFRGQLSGRFHRMVEMPVPARRLGRDHVIEPQDIVTMRVRDESLGTNLIVDPEKLIGQSVRRSLAAGKPVRQGDVQPPLLVRKNRVVTVMLNTREMTLTVSARAMEDGALGDIVRVQNTQSTTVIDAEVIGEGRLRVILPEVLAMQPAQ